MPGRVWTGLDRSSTLTVPNTIAVTHTHTITNISTSIMTMFLLPLQTLLSRRHARSVGARPGQVGQYLSGQVCSGHTSHRLSTFTNPITRSHTRA